MLHGPSVCIKYDAFGATMPHGPSGCTKLRTLPNQEARVVALTYA